jgi:Phosphotransferase system, mannose/fructose-specific component IIA
MSDAMHEPDVSLPTIVVLTHGRAGEELIKSAEMIVGPMDNVYALSLMPGMGLESFMAQVNKVLEHSPEGAVLISDLFGGTPANTSAIVSKTKNISAVSGLSLSMLIEAASCRERLSGEQLADTIITAGKEGCRNIITELKILD